MLPLKRVGLHQMKVMCLVWQKCVERALNSNRKRNKRDEHRTAAFPYPHQAQSYEMQQSYGDEAYWNPELTPCSKQHFGNYYLNYNLQNN